MTRDLQKLLNNVFLDRFSEDPQVLKCVAFVVDSFIPINKNMPRSNKKKKVVENSDVAHAPTSTTKADDALNTNLKKRLQTRVKMMSTSRRGGTSNQVAQVMNKFNDVDDEKLELMKDIQDDVKGMNAKDAKKYLKKIVNTMDNDQSKQFMDVVKDKIPGQSKEIVNYVQRSKNSKQKEEDAKPKVNAETVYVPTRLLTEEQKASAKAQRAGEVVKKKKKSFRPIQITVPKINELRGEATEPEKKKEVVKKTVPATTTDTRHLTLAARTQCLSKFNASAYDKSMRQFLFEAAEDSKIVTITDVTPSKFPPIMPTPDSEEVVPFAVIPEKYQNMLQMTPVDFVGDATHPFLYRHVLHTATSAPLSLSTTHNDDQYIRAKNAYPACFKFLLKYLPIIKWLKTLVGNQVPMVWLNDHLANLGILEQNMQTPQDQLFYRLLGEEYSKTAVPMIPFVKITVK